MRRFSLTVAVILFLGSLSFSIIVLPDNVSAKTLFVGGSGPGNYSSIQNAIDAAEESDTIYVFSGTYHETLLVEKVLSIVGENWDTTTINGDGTAPVVNVTADWVNITDVTITKGGGGWFGAGIELYHVSNCWIEDIKFISNPNGIHLSSSNHNTIANNAFRGNSAGILLHSSHENSVLNNDEEGHYGAYLWDSDRNLIFNNSAVEGYRGYHLYRSDNNTLSNNTASLKLHEGIYVHESSNNIISNNSFFANKRPAILLDSSINTVLTKNDMVKSGIFIVGQELKHWNSHTIDNTNIANGNPVYYWKDIHGGRVPSNAGQVILANCTRVVVENQVVNDVYAGIELGMSSNNTLSNNTASSNYLGYGMVLLHSDNNTLSNNTASSNYWNGIFLTDSHNNTLVGNFADNNDNGIDLHLSNYNIIRNSDLTSNAHSIYLLWSHHNLIENNSASFSWNGISLVDADNNTVGGNNASGNGHGIWVGSGDNIILNNTAMNGDIGIAVIGDNNTVIGNNVSNNGWGFLTGRAGNTFADNSVWYNEYGIHNGGSCWWVKWPNCRNDFRSNHISLNDFGFYSLRSDGTIVANNSISYNLEGIHLEDSTSHAIYHNNIIGNALQAYDDNDTNQWDNGYPLGGNYWSDYSGVDFYSGPNQDLPGSDQIGDRPFVIDSDSVDRYPLMEPFGQQPVRSVTLDIDPDTLNVRSRGRWITAYLITEDAMAENIVASSLVLNDLIRPMWWNLQNETTLMVKFDRAAVQAIVPVSDMVDIKVIGQWKNGESFELHDIIRVIDLGAYRVAPQMFSALEMPISFFRENFDAVSPFREPMEAFED
jgi:parallel beta-helix repeat protein